MRAACVRPWSSAATASSAAHRRHAVAARLFDRHGEVPLPPYITRRPDANDEARYQTVYARHAARWRRRPPACISTPRCSRRARSRIAFAGVTARGRRHVRAAEGDDLAAHRMHSEWYGFAGKRRRGRRRPSARAHRRRRTTTLRALESAASEQGTIAAGEAETAAVHHAGDPVSRRRSAADELPSAEIHAARARVRVRRSCGDREA